MVKPFLFWLPPVVCCRYFPEFCDKLPRERAFFKGPKPYLLLGDETTGSSGSAAVASHSGTTEVLELLLQAGKPDRTQVRSKNGISGVFSWLV